MSFLKKKFRDIKKFPDWIFLLIVGLMYFYKLLMRKRYIDPQGVLNQPDPPGIAVTWHNRLMFFPLMFPKKLRSCTSAVISASRDGQYVADLDGNRQYKRFQFQKRNERREWSCPCFGSWPLRCLNSRWSARSPLSHE